MTEQLMHQDEIDSLVKRFGHPVRRDCTLEVSAQTYYTWVRKLSTGPVACRGEVIMVILRPNGNVLLHTKDFYPHGIYRLPSGRVLWQDRVEETLRREVKEETNLDVEVERFLGLIEYEFCCQGNSLPFVSYIFELREVGGDLRCLDRHEGITGFCEALVTELSDVALHLEQLEPDWQDWGNFRAVPHRMAAQILAD